MSAVLVLVRHAKAMAGMDDEARELAPRGRRDAERLGPWLAGQGIVADRVVVSPATRTRQTWELIAAGLGQAPAPVFDERIYDDTLDDLYDVLADTPEDTSTLLVVGHNPAVEELAADLVPGDSRLSRGLATCAVAVFDVDGAWDDPEGWTVQLRFVARPGDLDIEQVP